MERPPDLVLIMTDEQRFDWMGHVGDGQYETPHLDALAADGIRFDRAYSASTVCVPARTSLLTGLHHHRALEQEGKARSLREGFWTIARELRAAGYETALIGRMHFKPVHSDHGFETMRMCENVNVGSGYGPEDVDDYGAWLAGLGRPDWRVVSPGPEGTVVPQLAGIPRVFPDDLEHHSTSWIERESVSFLRSRQGDRPLFLVVSFPHPHAPYDPPEPYASMYDRDTTLLPADGFEVNDVFTGAFRKDVTEYWTSRIDSPERVELLRDVLTAVRGLVGQIDDAVGRIVAELDLPSSLVVFTSDHGDFGGHRGLFSKIPWIPVDDLVRVPMIVAGGALAGAARSSAAPVQSASFAPTCLDYAGIDVDPALFDFPSLRPLLDADDDDALDPDHPRFAAVSAGYPMVRRGPHKAIHSWHTGEVVVFDVEQDPGETVAVTDDPAYAEVREELHALMLAELHRPPVDPWFHRHLPTPG